MRIWEASWGTHWRTSMCISMWGTWGRWEDDRRPGIDSSTRGTCQPFSFFTWDRMDSKRGCGRLWSVWLAGFIDLIQYLVKSGGCLKVCGGCNTIDCFSPLICKSLVRRPACLIPRPEEVRVCSFHFQSDGRAGTLPRTDLYKVYIYSAPGTYSIVPRYKDIYTHRSYHLHGPSHISSLTLGSGSGRAEMVYLQQRPTWSQ